MKRATGVALLAVLIGAVLLALFSRVYPGTAVREVATVTALVSLLTAAVVDAGVRRWWSRREPDE